MAVIGPDADHRKELFIDFVRHTCHHVVEIGGQVTPASTNLTGAARPGVPVKCTAGAAAERAPRCSIACLGEPVLGSGTKGTSGWLTSSTSTQWGHRAMWTPFRSRATRNPPRPSPMISVSGGTVCRIHNGSRPMASDHRHPCHLGCARVSSLQASKDSSMRQTGQKASSAAGATCPWRWPNSSAGGAAATTADVHTALFTI